MVRTTTLAAAAASLLVNVQAGSLYTKNSAVLQISGVDYDRVIAKSNYTSIVEFYAPWCGHCQNLKPAYEKAAKSLAGLAKVAAVNCDDEVNKPFCGQMGVQGFPTLKIVRPGKKPGKPSVEDYQGPREAKAIIGAVKDKIPNSVKRLTDKNFEEWLEEDKESPKAILFSDKGLTSATLKTLAIDFAGVLPIAQIRNKEKAAMEKFAIEKVPTLILLPGDGKDPIVFEGENTKDAMLGFLTQAATPNPDCPPPKEKKPKSKKDDKKASKSSSKFSKASASHKSADASSAAASAQSETVEEPVVPTESPDPKLKTDDSAEPIIIPVKEVKPTIPVIAEQAELQASCLTTKSLTCILALLPNDEASEASTTALASLASIHQKHDKSGAHLFPFIGVPASNPLAASILAELKFDSTEQPHLIATNGKRSWYKKYSGETFGAIEIEAWVDAIRMGDGKKEKLPDLLIVEAEEKPEVKEEKPIEQEPLDIKIEELPDDFEIPPPQKKHDEL